MVRLPLLPLLLRKISESHWDSIFKAEWIQSRECFFPVMLYFFEIMFFLPFWITPCTHTYTTTTQKDWKETGPNVKTYLFTLFFTPFCIFHNRNITLIIRLKKKTSDWKCFLGPIF